MLYACDGKWWDSVDGAPDFPGLKVSQDAGAAQRWGVNRVPSENGKGLSLDPLRIHQGANSGYQTLNLSIFLAGPGRRILLGFDMKPAANGRLHHHGDHTGRLSNPNAGSLKKWAERFAETLPDLQRAGVEVINCSRDTALTCFPRAELSEVLP
jgi:hypothetical protein